MATINKTERKKLVSTSVVGAAVIWHDMRDGGEFARVNIDQLDGPIRDKLIVYGLKQIVADIVAGVGGADGKVKGMAAAITSIEQGVWPSRASERSLEGPIAMLMAVQGCDRAVARAMLGLTGE
jgi:hypothetical protein